MGWNALPVYRESFNAPAPSAPAPAPAAPHPVGACGFDWGRVQYGEFRSDNSLYGRKAAPHLSAFVISAPPRAGYYHEVLGLSYSGTTASGSQVKAIFLLPPQYADVQKIIASLFTNFGDGVSTPSPDSIPAAGVRISAGSTNNLAPINGFHFGVFTPSDRLIIPPGWCLLLCRDDASPSDGSGTVDILQMAFIEVQIGDDAVSF